MEYAACQTEATALRVMLMATACEGWGIWSVDVRNAFLNAELDDEDVALVKPPRVFVEAGAARRNIAVGEGNNFMV